MMRPVSKKCTPAQTSFSPEIALNLVAYFTNCLEKAKKAHEDRAHGTVTFPTIKGFCALTRINHNTARGWARKKPLMRQALQSCADIRLQISRLELENVVFDVEVTE